jgi:hypothetical protein
MGVPRDKEIRRYFQCAFQRHDDALVLLRAGKTTGAVYLAGYAVECMLKALILSSIPPARRMAASRDFRGKKAHDYEELRRQYRKATKGRTIDFPSEINQAFTLVGWWSTDLRYEVGLVLEREAIGFLMATKNILDWTDRKF